MRVLGVSKVVAAFTVVTLVGACSEPFSPSPNSGPDQVLTVTAPGSVQARANQLKKLQPNMDPGRHRKQAL